MDDVLVCLRRSQRWYNSKKKGSTDMFPGINAQQRLVLADNRVLVLLHQYQPTSSHTRDSSGVAWRSEDVFKSV